jgi:hypothetical protein
MPFGRSGMTSGRDSGFCITIMHRATHRSLQQFLALKITPVITQPLSSPDLDPSNFWLFHTLTMRDGSLRPYSLGFLDRSRHFSIK